MDPYNPKIGDRMYTPSGAFEYTDSPRNPEFDHMDVIGAVAGLLIIVVLCLVAWKAIPKIAGDLHRAEAVEQLRSSGY